MSPDTTPLYGPAWSHPLVSDAIAQQLAAEPCGPDILGTPCAIPHGCQLFVATSRVQGAVIQQGGQATLSGCVCVLGAFDGVHAGHRALIARAAQDAHERDVPLIAVTFDPDPAEVLGKTRHNWTLLSIADRVRILAALGVDGICVVPFTDTFSHVSYEEFFRQWLMDDLGILSVHVGCDFRMGAHGDGDISALRSLGEREGICVYGHELVSQDGMILSATVIRHLIRAGSVHEAALLLERYHLVRGVVIHGRGEGTSFGFPTANVRCSVTDCLPAEGVYAAFVCQGDRAWPAAVNVGAPRTFQGVPNQPFLEATLLGFSGNLYDTELAVCFVTWLREPRVFPSLAELEKTVSGNVAWVRHNLGACAFGRDKSGVWKPQEEVQS